MKIRVISKSGVLPRKETEGAAGMDLRAFLEEPAVIGPMERRLIPTGLFLEVEPGCEVQIRARSGLALRHGVCLVNGIGTIDSDYRGEVGVALINLGQEPYTIRNGDRIAQMVAARREPVEWEKTEKLGETSRGAGGFGHTGEK